MDPAKLWPAGVASDKKSPVDAMRGKREGLCSGQRGLTGINSSAVPHVVR